MGINNVISLLGGVALFLFGMTLMGDGLKKVAGNKLEIILYKLTSTPLKGVLLGTGVTAVIQSSSATSVMVVGFVNSGMMQVRQAIGIVLGSILGTSITGWILCLSDISGSGWVSLLSTATLTGVVAVAGIALRMFCKDLTKHHIGDILLGFAVLMYGMSSMSGAVAPLKDSAAFIELLTRFSNPLLGVLVGTVFTCILQSASAAVGILQAGRLIFKKKPACVIGFGGYASFPSCMAAILLGTDLVIHEQNSVMSRTNRFLSKYAALIAQSFKKVKYAPAGIKTILTGMPIRKTIAEVREIPFPALGKEDKFQIMVLGGSQGAKIFGDVVPEVIKKLSPARRKKIRIFQQCREADVENVKAAYDGCGAEVTVSHFFNNMPELYAGTHLIISRAGASSVSEIAAVGIPSILVPLPIAADDHQTANAREIGDAKAGIVLKQKDFTPARLGELLKELMSSPKKLSQMSENAKSVGITDAAVRFADAVEKEILSRP